ncbi:hypothetical protein D3C78_1471500 [compost metagenome]
MSSLPCPFDAANCFTAESSSALREVTKEAGEFNCGSFFRKAIVSAFLLVNAKINPPIKISGIIKRELI